MSADTGLKLIPSEWNDLFPADSYYRVIHYSPTPIRFWYVMLCGEARTPPRRGRGAAVEQEGEAQSHRAERTEQRLHRAYGSIAGLPHPRSYFSHYFSLALGTRPHALPGYSSFNLLWVLLGAWKDIWQKINVLTVFRVPIFMNASCFSMSKCSLLNCSKKQGVCVCVGGWWYIWEKGISFTVELSFLFRFKLIYFKLYCMFH